MKIWCIFPKYMWLTLRRLQICFPVVIYSKENGFIHQEWTGLLQICINYITRRILHRRKISTWLWLGRWFTWFLDDITKWPCHIRAPDNRRHGGSSGMFCCNRWHWFGYDINNCLREERNESVDAVQCVTTQVSYITSRRKNNCLNKFITSVKIGPNINAWNSLT